MKSLQLRILSLMLLLSPFAKGQSGSSLELTSAVGISCYYGDLIQGSPAFNQPSLAVTEGIAYNFTPHWNWRSDVSFLQVKASDSKNKRADLKARNLSFKSAIWNVNTAVEYDIWNTEENHVFNMYGFLGIGIFHFNPYTTDRNGNKQYLRIQGTEGQGTAAYPDRQPYKLTQIEIPFGMGIKFALNDRLNLGFELKYHYIDTDYLDDVSMASYPDRAVLAAKDPNLPMLTYRGDELPGGAPYPANGTNLNRGNPNNRDSYYSAQIRMSYRLRGNSISINY